MSDWRIRHEDVDGRDAQSTVVVKRMLLSRPYTCSAPVHLDLAQYEGKPARVIIEANSGDRLPRKLGAAFGRPFLFGRNAGVLLSDDLIE
jgi:hypothetical protein